MLTKNLAAISGALTLTIFLTAPASAQNTPSSGYGPANTEAISAPSSRVTPSRTARQREAAEARRRAQQPAAPDPAAIRAEAVSALAAGSTSCDVSDSKLLGLSAEQVKIFEVACSGAPGYIIVASTPPQIVDCVILAQTASTAAPAPVAPGAEAPAPATSPTCTLPANQDIQGFMKAYATQAGVPCTVDEVKVRGQSNDGAVVYEVGCAGVDGYWIEKNASGWEKTECLQIVSQNSTCQFTTPAEQAATVKSWLPGSDAAACDVQQVRLMGQNANGRFIEMTCAGADGFIIRQNAEKAIQQVYPCATAQQIGGGCKLTTTAPAAAPQA